MFDISINDPDANVIVTVNHLSFGEVPLLVEKSMEMAVLFFLIGTIMIIQTVALM